MSLCDCLNLQGKCRVIQKYGQTVGVQVDVNETETFFLILETVSGVTFYKTSLLSTQHSMQPDETA